MQFGTNHLGHFVLVNRMASLIRAGGRLVNLSSSGHRFSSVDLLDPNFERTAYDPWFGVWAVEDGKRSVFRWPRQAAWRARRAAAVHPGGIQTEFGRHIGAEEIQKLIDGTNAQSAVEGKGPFQWKTFFSKVQRLRGLAGGRCRG